MKTEAVSRRTIQAMYAYDPKNSAMPKAYTDKNNMLVMQLKCS